MIEAALGSGALITATSALDQGREVLAVPGSITSAVSSGCNRLIRDGATPYLEPADLLQFFPEAVPVPDEPAASDAGPAPLPESLGPIERGVAELLTAEAAHLDTLIARAGRPVGELLAVLCALELQGLAEQLPGRRFRRV